MEVAKQRFAIDSTSCLLGKCEIEIAAAERMHTSPDRGCLQEGRGLIILREELAIHAACPVSRVDRVELHQHQKTHRDRKRLAPSLADHLRKEHPEGHPHRGCETAESTHAPE